MYSAKIIGRKILFGHIELLKQVLSIEKYKFCQTNIIVYSLERNWTWDSFGNVDLLQGTAFWINCQTNIAVYSVEDNWTNYFFLAKNIIFLH